MRYYQFRCPACETETVVDADVRGLLLDDGCMVCGAEPTGEAFERADGERQ